MNFKKGLVWLDSRQLMRLNLDFWVMKLYTDREKHKVRHGLVFLLLRGKDAWFTKHLSV